ncbi:oxidoreductase short chain dehydrogenase/reductase family protein [Clostridium sp. CAG:524]|nr:oxidoreductase short chain dehydrogenase/reductase family protein [Clostridium sp. CAG:524]
MLALITGASNGLGKDFAKELSKQGYDLVLVARSKDKLDKLSSELKTLVYVEVMDLSVKENAYKLYSKYKGKIDLLINNAGFGTFGEFTKTDLETELNMIDLNITAYHILTKLFLQDFVKKNKGEILNVASSAAFEPGPLMSTYYATKSYVYNLTMGIYEELRRSKSKVKIHVLCPGPVDTGFNDRAHVKFGVKSLKSIDVVKYTLRCMAKNKLIIIPGFTIKLGVFANRILPRKLVIKVTYKIQKSKELKEK